MLYYAATTNGHDRNLVLKRDFKQRLDRQRVLARSLRLCVPTAYHSMYSDPQLVLLTTTTTTTTTITTPYLEKYVPLYFYLSLLNAD